MLGNPRSDHAGTDGIVVENLANRRGVTDHRHPSLVDEAK
jgi:hypothetical protein